MVTPPPARSGRHDFSARLAQGVGRREQARPPSAGTSGCGARLVERMLSRAATTMPPAVENGEAAADSRARRLCHRRPAALACTARGHASSGGDGDASGGNGGWQRTMYPLNARRPEHPPATGSARLGEL